jgi:A/G-specific adenine glycosylase
VAKAAKREESVAYCVLRAVLPAGTQPPAGQAPAEAAAAGTTGQDSDDGDEAAPPAAAAAAQPAAKRQKAEAGGKKPGAKAAGAQKAASMHSFLAGSQQLRAAESAGSVFCLLVQRPASGLLAGLWECPGAAMEGPAGSSARRQLVDGHLTQVLGLRLDSGAGAGGGGGGVKVLRRHDVGSAVHVFSHIRMVGARLGRLRMRRAVHVVWWCTHAAAGRLALLLTRLPRPLP